MARNKAGSKDRSERGKTTKGTAEPSPPAPSEERGTELGTPGLVAGPGPERQGRKRKKFGHN